MRVAIEPRKATDRGGYYCMPLKVNVPTGRKDWKLTKCPECGAQCWELPLAEVAKAQGAKGLCTMCALKKGVSGRRTMMKSVAAETACTTDHHGKQDI